MARKDRRNQQEEQPLLPTYDDFKFDDLDSITRDLPTGKPEEPIADQDDDTSDTPEKALRKLQIERDAIEEEQENATFVGRMKKKQRTSSRLQA